MRFIVIDNSTLTAVQRIMGDIPIRNKYLIDADIPALENYVQSILFYDYLVFLDDYKEEFRPLRRAYFSRMQPLQYTDASYASLVKASQEVMNNIHLHVKGGMITDKDFAPFFNLLRMNVTFTWDMSSSVYYLTEKMLESVGGLDLPKYSELASMIYAELMEKSANVGSSAVEDQVQLFDSRGRPITSNYQVADRRGARVDAHLSGLLTRQVTLDALLRKPTMCARRGSL